VNHSERFVAFGAWDVNTMGRRCLILSGKWQFKNTVRRTLGYPQSREHIWLVAQAGYSMMTFPMKSSNSRQDEHGNGPPVRDDFTPVLSTRGLLQIGNDWCATDLTQDEGEIGLAEEREAPERYPEGARKQICVNAIEQSRQARDACIEHHGLDCVACGFNFQRVYGQLGERFIHGHHLVPVEIWCKWRGKRGREASYLVVSQAGLLS
jgi:5-methylcytosine-specific restriction protein A